MQSIYSRSVRVDRVRNFKNPSFLRFFNDKHTIDISLSYVSIHICFNFAHKSNIKK